jgi:ribosomal protein S18 acetylase RimI-like enzyme
VKQLPSVAAIYEQMDQARRAGPLLTNFYPAPDKLQRSIERGELFSVTAGNVLFVLRRDRDFLHLSFVASTTAELAAALREFVASVAETVTVDVLGPRERVAELAALFVQAGFRAHCELHRMTKTTQPTQQAANQAEPPAPPDPEVVFAGRDDGGALAGMLETALDRHAEQIPDEDEMARAASERKVLVIRSGPAIAGLLFFEVTGQSSLLRHWLVDPAYREQRIGARLMRRYFADCKDVRRFLLWVISDNHNAIDRYRHYGYREDGLIDQVLIRRPS